MLQTSKLPVGVSDFGRLIRDGYVFCDKTAFIADFLNRGDMVTLLTRPRRWGKTLTLSMLQHFLSAQVHGQSTQGLFDGTIISGLNDGYYRRFQGQSPVIFISLKDIRGHSFQDLLQKTQSVMADVYRQFRDIWKDEKLISAELRQYAELILNGNIQASQLESSLKILSEGLFLYYQKPVYVLIDEYDTPLNSAYLSGCLEESVPFFRGLLSGVLKDNPYLARGVLTGILRVAKDSAFSGLNNIFVCGVLDSEYQSHLGFLEHEVEKLFINQNLEKHLPNIKKWYNGYRIGNTNQGMATLYNPWSIIYCLSNAAHCDLYWIHTGNNEIIQKAILESENHIDEALTHLIKGNSVEVPVDLFTQFSQIPQNEAIFWGLLLAAGYVTSESDERFPQSTLKRCRLRIPNEEILSLMSQYVEQWLPTELGVESHTHLMTSILRGDPELWCSAVQSFLRTVASYFDLNQSKTGESFYHGFCLGLLSQLYATHRVRSNRELGEGRCDLFIVPHVASYSTAWIIELKYSADEKKLKSVAQRALKQIQDKRYGAEIKEYPSVTSVIYLGIAFNGKQSAHVSKTLSISQRKTT